MKAIRSALMVLLVSGCLMPLDEASEALDSSPFFLQELQLTYGGDMDLLIDVGHGPVVDGEGVVRDSYVIRLIDPDTNARIASFAVDGAGHLVRSVHECIPGANGDPCVADRMYWTTYGMPPPFGLGWPVLGQEPDIFQQPYIDGWHTRTQEGADEIQFLDAPELPFAPVPFLLSSGTMGYLSSSMYPDWIEWEYGGASKKVHLVDVRRGPTLSQVPVWPAPVHPNNGTIGWNELEPVGVDQFHIGTAVEHLRQAHGLADASAPCYVRVDSSVTTTGPAGLLPEQWVIAEIRLHDQQEARSFEVSRNARGAYDSRELNDASKCAAPAAGFNLQPAEVEAIFDRLSLEHTRGIEAIAWIGRYAGGGHDPFRHPSGAAVAQVNFVVEPSRGHQEGSGSSLHFPHNMFISAADGWTLALSMDPADRQRLDRDGF